MLTVGSLRLADCREGLFPPSEALLGKGRIMDWLTVLSSGGGRFLKEALAALDIGKREPP